MQFNGYETTNYPNGISTTLSATNNGSGAPFSGINAGEIGQFTSVTTLTAAQVNALNATSIQLLPAPGANQVIVLNLIVLETLFNTTAYANANNAVFQFLLNATVASDMTLAQTTAVLTAAAKTLVVVDSPNVNVAELLTTNIVNQPLNVNLSAALTAVGNSPIKISTFFSVLPV
jgi:hypothetical protein